MLPMTVPATTLMMIRSAMPAMPSRRRRLSKPMEIIDSNTNAPNTALCTQPTTRSEPGLAASS
jgi:hypothetical protein